MRTQRQTQKGDRQDEQGVREYREEVQRAPREVQRSRANHDELQAKHDELQAMKGRPSVDLVQEMLEIIPDRKRLPDEFGDMPGYVLGTETDRGRVEKYSWSCPQTS